jgi:ferric iron reductase protein FhuF
MNATDIQNFANEVRKVTIETRERIGKLIELNTADKTDVVKAINEVNQKIINNNTGITDGGIIY